MSKNVNIKELFSYEFDCEMPGSGERIKFKPISTGQLKKLLVYENETRKSIIDDVIDSLISDCVVSENFNINDLYLLDRFYLMLQIRMKSKGEEYEIVYKCPECGMEVYRTVDLTELDVVPYDKNNTEHFIKCNDKVEIYVDFLTRGEEKELSQDLQKELGEIKVDKDGEFDNRFLGSYALKYIEYSIKKIKINSTGDIVDLSKEEKEEVIDSLTEENIVAIRNWYDDNKFGVDFTINLECPHGHENKIELPTDRIFF